jgi:hypothetical protein
MEVEEYNSDVGYRMGVYLCLGQPIHSVKPNQSILLNEFTKYADIHQYMSQYNRIFVFLGEGTHKIKKKAEQFACEDAIRKLNTF